MLTKGLLVRFNIDQVEKSWRRSGSTISMVLEPREKRHFWSRLFRYKETREHVQYISRTWACNLRQTLLILSANLPNAAFIEVQLYYQILSFAKSKHRWYEFHTLWICPFFLLDLMETQLKRCGLLFHITYILY